MMKNFKKFTAFVLALCMVFSLSVAVFAADSPEIPRPRQVAVGGRRPDCAVAGACGGLVADAVESPFDRRVRSAWREKRKACFAVREARSERSGRVDV